MRVLCITSHADTLHSIRPEAEQLIGLAESGVEVTVMTEGDSVYAAPMREAGITLVDFVPRRKLSLAAIRRIRRELRDGHYDIVYAFNNKAIANTAWAALGIPVKFITYRGQTGNIRRYDPSGYVTHLHPRVDGIIGVANAVRDDLRRQVRDPQSVVTVYKGHSLAWYQAPPIDRAALGLPADAFVVGCVSNNRPRKGVPVLVEACGLLTDLPDLHLVLVGAGMDAPELVSAISRTGIAGRIHVLGYRHDAPAVLQACDVSVLPSTKREGLPKTVIESMVYSIAPIVTDTGGNAELVSDGESGLVVPPSDAAALAAALRFMHANPDQRKQMGRAARVRIAEQFSVEKSVRDTRAAFEYFLAR